MSKKSKVEKHQEETILSVELVIDEKSGEEMVRSRLIGRGDRVMAILHSACDNDKDMREVVITSCRKFKRRIMNLKNVNLEDFDTVLFICGKKETRDGEEGLAVSGFVSGKISDIEFILFDCVERDEELKAIVMKIARKIAIKHIDEMLKKG